MSLEILEFVNFSVYYPHWDSLGIPGIVAPYSDLNMLNWAFLSQRILSQLGSSLGRAVLSLSRNFVIESPTDLGY